MRILFLNQFFPPDPAPTGVLLHELAERLRARGHEVEFISAGQSYRENKGGGRLSREFRALVTMLGAGLTAARPDVVFSASSPPCLLFVATLIAKWHRARSIHWAMDLYPEIAVVLGELRDGVVTDVIRRIMGWSYRQAAGVVALDEDMAARIAEHGVEVAAIVRPWITGGGLGDGGHPDRSGQGAGESSFTWIYSGNLGRAHEWETLLDAQRILEERGLAHRLVFQGGGPAWSQARERAGSLGLRNVEWRGYVEAAELADSLRRCQALAVTQRPETQGLLWPSKLALVLALGRPVLFVGPLDGAIAWMLREGTPGQGGADAEGTPGQGTGPTFSVVGLFAPGEGGGVADWLEKRGLEVREGLAIDRDPVATRESGLGVLVGLVEEGNGL